MNLWDSFEDFVSGVFKWVALVAAIAVGVCLGLYLFGRLVGAELQHDTQNIWPPSVTTTTYAP